METLVSLLIAKNLTISSVESLTAGMFASSIASIENASKVLKGGLITYTNECKIDVLGIDKQIVESEGVISEACVKAMVLQGEKMFHTDLVVSFSGNAGPSAMEGKEVGLVYMGLFIKGRVYTFNEVFKGDRQTVRKQCIQYMVNEIKQKLG